MDGVNPTSNHALEKLIFDEAHRQNSVILGTADALQAKVGLYLVFAAFVFTGQIELIKIGRIGNITVNLGLAVISAALVLIAALCLLRAALVRSYIMPPLIARFRQQTMEMATCFALKGHSAPDSLVKIQRKFVNSLGRAVDNNFKQNQMVAHSASVAAWLLVLAILGLVLSVAVPALALVWA